MENLFNLINSSGKSILFFSLNKNANFFENLNQFKDSLLTVSSEANIIEEFKSSINYINLERENITQVEYRVIVLLGITYLMNGLNIVDFPDKQIAGISRNFGIGNLETLRDRLQEIGVEFLNDNAFINLNQKVCYKVY